MATENDYPLTSAASRCWTENQRWLMSLVH